MSNYDAADGCVISKVIEDQDASSQVATQPSDYLSESISNGYCENDRSFEEEDPVSYCCDKLTVYSE
jgi:hypothetical protein